MIAVDSSVWIDYFRDHSSEQVELLDGLIGREPLLVGDVVLCEVLQGARDDAEAQKIETRLRRFEFVSMLSPELAVLAASNYRRLRTVGFTVRKTIDLVIGTFCIANGHWLLHSDRDFEPMRLHLGLRIV